MQIAPRDLVVSQLGEPRFSSPLALSTCHGDGLGDYVQETTRVRYELEFHDGVEASSLGFEKAGPRERLFFDPPRTRAAIVTCGGLCPGLNNVIRSLVLELLHNYRIRDVLGIRFGYQGLNPRHGLPPLPLTLEAINGIHRQGGTLLGSSRGPEEPAEMVDFLQQQQIDILFCLGGDGTLRGAHALAQEISLRGAPIAVIGVPKTIDNDVPFVTRSFGFATALDVASQVLDAAHNESKGAPNGIGLVKLMGREAGFIAAGATLASQEVNFTLIPEVPFPLEGPDGFLEALERRVVARRHAVVVVAEGTGQHLLERDPANCDASGNVKLADIGLYLKRRIGEHFAAAQIPVNVKYFDPSYLIRGVAANSDDALFCDALARNAAHAAMAGRHDMLLGQWHGAFTHVPIPLVAGRRHRISPESELWTRVLLCTGQPRWC